LSETPAAYVRAGDPAREAVVARIVATFEAMMHSVASAHAPEFLEVGVTMSQAKVLYLVQAAPGLRMSDLSARLGISLSTVSGVVDRLVDQGLLDRRDDPADRRHVVLRMTDAGTTQLQLFRELNEGQIRTLLSRMDAADLALIGQALDVLAAAAARHAATPTASHITEGEPA
jgi:DNA-binding MarR family transcriptional regulator